MKRLLVILLIEIAAAPGCWRVAAVDDNATDTESGGFTDGDVDGDADADTGADADTILDTDADTDGGLEIEWIFITRGTFMMGSEDGDSDELPVHPVTVPGFEMMKTEVTVVQFEACANSGACGEEGNWYTNFDAGLYNFGRAERSEYPMNGVDWYIAREFCEWAGGRLPTEAEWEYAARSEGEEIEYPWGNEEPTCDLAVMDDGGDGCGLYSTWPVCSKPLGNTEQGLCDMAGNVWEWVADDDHDDYTGAPTDGSAWVTGEARRVVRGGSWDLDSADFLRSADRERCNPTYRNDCGGFRCVRSLEP